MEIELSVLLEHRSLLQDLGTLFGLLGRHLIRGRGTHKVVASKGSWINVGLDRLLRVEIEFGILLQESSLFQDLGTLSSFFKGLLLRGRGTGEVVASTGSRISGDNRFLRVQVEGSIHFELLDILEDTSSFLAFLNG